MKNENKVDEMVDILEHLTQYVPRITYNEANQCSNGDVVFKDKSQFHCILFGGDQLTVKRARSAMKVKVNSNDSAKKLVCWIPVVEDWHAKANFLGVSFCQLAFFI